MTPAKVIIVEDDESACTSIQCLLRAFDFEVMTFGSGEAFLEAQPAQTGDCFLVDMQLPGMSGMQLRKAIHREQSDTPVILVSGYVDAATRSEASEAGISAVLEKPVRPLRLIEEVRRAIARSRKESAGS